MKTNTAHTSIVGMTRLLTEILAEATEISAAAAGCDHPEEQNQLIGTLLPIEEKLEMARALLAATMSIHRGRA
jgi:hypothetical protein